MNKCSCPPGTTGIDPCIQPLIDALNSAGIKTIASCCGHNRRPGNVILADGRWLVLARDYEEGQKIEDLFPLDIHGMTLEERLNQK